MLKESKMQTRPIAAPWHSGVLCLLLCALSVPGVAQEAEESEAEVREIEEIIVTVERRAQNLQDLGVTAYNFTGEDLALVGAQDITDLSELAPGLEIGNKGGNVEVWIRGVGSSNNTELGDPAAAFHFDGVYIPRTAGIGSAFFDIAGGSQCRPPGHTAGPQRHCWVHQRHSLATRTRQFGWFH